MLCQQLLQPRILDGSRSGAQLRIHLFNVVFRMRKKIAEVVIAFQRRNNLLERQFLLPIEQFHPAAYLNHVVALEGRYKSGEVLPHFPGNCAGSVHQLKL